MFSYSRQTVIVLAALAAFACARPDDSVTFFDTPKQKTETETQNGSSKEQAVDTNETDAVRPVHERFPHAVLFGGTCGGSIISPTWVLTAGHCTLFTSGRYVMAGTNNSADQSGIVRRVKRLVIHPLFTVGPYWLNADLYDIKQVAAKFDFLLIELSEPLPINNKTIATVKLDDQPNIPVDLDVGYAGYGAEHHGEVMRNNMHGMDLVTVADDVCARKLVQFDSQDMLCVKGRPPRYDSACNGDSGSGLVSEGRLLGVASWVENDAHECFNGALVVFAKVSRVREWIRQVTGV